VFLSKEYQTPTATNPLKHRWFSLNSKWFYRKIVEVGCSLKGLLFQAKKVAANFWNRIWMQPMKNGVMEWRDLPVFFWGVGQGRRFFLKSCVWCREWTVCCSLSTWTVDNQLSMQALWCVKPKQFPSSWHVPQRVHNRTSLLCLANVGPKGTSSILQNRTFYFGGLP
jgi:hypothetical protein